jgi:hypothetical protein
VVYAHQGPNLLVDVKGCKHAAGNGRQLQNRVTQDDIDCLKRCAGIFGEGFEPVSAFLFLVRRPASWRAVSGGL